MSNVTTIQRPLLELAIESKVFDRQPVLGGVHLEVSSGEIVSIVGPSGCGKSTLLRIICGLDGDYRGNVSVLGQQPRLHSGDVGLIFQEPRLLPWLTVAENVGFDLGRSRVACLPSPRCCFWMSRSAQSMRSHA
jgi:sulfonate transport system ATP-binding protein